ncbi:MAG: substrate-binding domain-containing protein [Planctomycetota bacterium]
MIKENPLQRYPRINRGDLRQFDGIMSLGIQDEDYIGDLEAVGLPVVVADYWPVLSGVDAVSVDGRRAGAMAAEILYDKRHEYLAFIGHGRGNPTHGEFYKDTDAVAMEDGIRLMAGMRGFSRFAVFYPKSGAREATLTDFITDMLSRKERPTGIIRAGVGAARDILTTAQRIGLNCPRDFSLITMTVVEDQTDIEKFARLTFALREMGEIVVELQIS